VRSNAVLEGQRATDGEVLEELRGFEGDMIGLMGVDGSEATKTVHSLRFRNCIVRARTVEISWTGQRR
jgi:hypothetical protein